MLLRLNPHHVASIYYWRNPNEAAKRLIIATESADLSFPPSPSVRPALACVVMMLVRATAGLTQRLDHEVSNTAGKYFEYIFLNI